MASLVFTLDHFARILKPHFPVDRGMRTAATLALAALLWAPATPAWGQGQSWAVVVGIDDYTYLHGVEGGDLLGAEYDARGFTDYLLQGQGLPEENVLLLLGADATGTAIRAGLAEWLPARVGPGDRVYVFYSGHGSQILDNSGDEDDGMDETISPVDALPLSPRNDIVDDEIDELLSGLEAAEVVVILDSCSPGTATKVPGLEGRPRRLSRPVQRPKAVGEDRYGSGLVDGSGREGTRKVVELAASAPYQTALDAVFLDEEGEVDFYGGAFTTHLLQRLWAADDTTSLARVLEQTREDMQEGRFQQVPQFSGPGTAPVKARRPDGGAQPK